MAQLVVSIEAELAEGGCQTQQLSEAFVALDGNLELDLQVAASEKSVKFKISDVRMVQDILKAHNLSNEDKFKTTAAKRLVAAGELEREEFHLMLQMFEQLAFES